MPNASDVVTRYLTSLADSDLDEARSLLADDFSFMGPGMTTALDKEAFLTEFGGKYRFVRELRMLRQLEDAGEVCSLYEFDVETRAASTTFLMTEWNTVRDGQVASSLLVFDTAVGAQLHQHT